MIITIFKIKFHFSFNLFKETNLKVAKTFRLTLVFIILYTQKKQIIKRFKMCQMSVVIQKEEKTDKIIEEVVKVEIINNGIQVSTFFDDPKFIDNVMIKEIDCLGSTVTLLDREE